jgi:hypothetical protein
VTADEIQARLDKMGPGFIMVHEADQYAVADAFMVDDTTLRCYPLDPEDRPVTVKVSGVSEASAGLIFDTPLLYFALWPLPDVLDPGYRKQITEAVTEARRTREWAQAQYQGVAA